MARVVTPRKCKMCGEMFQPTARGQKFCGTQKARGSCSWHNGRTSTKKYVEENYSKVRAQIKAAYLRVKADPIKYAEYLEKQRDSDRLVLYGLTREHYEQMRARQGGGCAICGRSRGRMFRGKPRDLAVDHDHDTGVVRGLLCDDCNVGLGLFVDDPLILRKAAAYVEAAKEKE